MTDYIFQDAGLTQSKLHSLNFETLQELVIRDDIKHSAHKFLRDIGITDMRPEVFLTAFLFYFDPSLTNEDIHIQSKLILRLLETPSRDQHTMKAVLGRYNSLFNKWKKDDKSKMISEMTECYNRLLDYYRYVDNHYTDTDRETFITKIKDEIEEYVTIARQMGFSLLIETKVEQDIDPVLRATITKNLQRAFWDIIKEKLILLYTPDIVIIKEDYEPILNLFQEIRDLFLDMANMKSTGKEQEIAHIQEYINIAHFEHLIVNNVFDQKTIQTVAKFLFHRCQEYISPFEDLKDIREKFDKLAVRIDNEFSVDLLVDILKNILDTLSVIHKHWTLISEIKQKHNE